MIRVHKIHVFNLCVMLNKIRHCNTYPGRGKSHFNVNLNVNEMNLSYLLSLEISQFALYIYQL